MKRSRLANQSRSSHLGRLHSDEGGQISFIAVFGAVAFVALLGMVLTTGDQVTLKMRMQDTVDAAALSGGAWIARGLNITSAFNVVQTQLVGGAILLNALASTLEISEPIVRIQNALYKACMNTLIGAAVCVVPFLITEAQLLILPSLRSTVRRLADNLAKCDSGLFWRIAKALEWVNWSVHKTFYGIAVAETQSVAKANGAEVALLISGPVFHGRIGAQAFTLPTREVEFPAHCNPMEFGSREQRDRGYHILLDYPVRTGPYSLGRSRLKKITSLVTGFPPVGWAILHVLAEKQKRMLCRGEEWSATDVSIERPASSFQECRQLDGEAEWVSNVITTERLSEPLANPNAWLSSKTSMSLEGATADEVEQRIEDLRADPDIGSVQGGGSFKLKCRSGAPRNRVDVRRVLVSSDPNDYDYIYTFTTYTLKATTVRANERIEDSPAGGPCRLKPKAYLLVEDDDALRYLAVAYRTNRRIFFRGTPTPPISGEVSRHGIRAHPLEDPSSLVTYAQVEVYNGIHNDTYAQDWRVRLDHASLLEVPLEGILTNLGPLSRFMTRIAGNSKADSYWIVNNH